jgi:hypothetical protein
MFLLGTVLYSLHGQKVDFIGSSEMPCISEEKHRDFVLQERFCIPAIGNT